MRLAMIGTAIAGLALVTGAAIAQNRANSTPVYLDVEAQAPFKLRITNILAGNREILLTSIGVGSRRMVLPMALSCSPTPTNPMGFQHRHIRLEAFAGGKQYMAFVKGNLCEQDEEGKRSISVSFCKISQYCTESNRFSVHQVTVHAT